MTVLVLLLGAVCWQGDTTSCVFARNHCVLLSYAGLGQAFGLHVENLQSVVPHPVVQAVER